MEALKNERDKLMQRITEFLTPRITGDIGCSIQEREEFIREREQNSNRIGEIDVEIAKLSEQEAVKSKIVESAFRLYIGGKDITEGMAEEQKEFVELLYDEISAKVSAPLKVELQDKDDVIKMLKESVSEKDGLIAESKFDYSRIQNDYQLTLVSKELADAKVIELQEAVEGWESKHKVWELSVTEAEQKRDNAAEELRLANLEIDRLNALVNEYQTAKVHGEVEAQKIITIEQTERTDRLQELAEKLKFIKVEPVGALYTEVVDESGNKQVVSNKELEHMDIVDSFPELELPEPLDHTLSQDENPTEMAGQNLVLNPSEGTIHSDAGETKSEEDTTAEEAEKAVSEETFTERRKTEYVTREEFEVFKEYVYGYVVKDEVA